MIIQNSRIIIITYLKKNLLKSFSSLQKPTDEPNGQVDEIVLEPSPRLVVIKKVVASLVCALIFVTLLPAYSLQKVKGNLIYITPREKKTALSYFR